MKPSFPWNPLHPFILSGLLSLFFWARVPVWADEWLDMSGKPVPVVEEETPEEDSDLSGFYQEEDVSTLPGLEAFNAREQGLPGMAAGSRRGRSAVDGKTKIEKVWIWQESSDCLWNMAKEYYGNPYLWTKIYEANRNIIKDPRVIFPKQRIVIPPLEASAR